MKIAAFVLSILAIIISIIDVIISTRKTNKAQKTAETALKSSHANNEMMISEMLSNSRNRIREFGYSYGEEEELSKKQRKRRKKEFYSVLEDYFNKYEVACQMYLDEKIDRSTFESQYKQDIIRNVQNERYDRFYEDPKRYPATVRVYEAWVFGRR